MLSLQFSTGIGRVTISSDAERLPDLRKLRGRFRTSSAIESHAFDVEIDDLLVNVVELARWPTDDTDIRWEQTLRELIMSNAADAKVVQATLHGASASESFPEIKEEMLGEGWQASLTTLQRRDLSKLMSLGHGAAFSVPGAGKTRLALATIQRRRDEGRIARTLVVSPKSAFESWIAEVGICYPQEQRPRVEVLESSTFAPECDILLVNYERLPDARETLSRWLKQQPAMLLLDEAHRMKLGAAGAWGATCLALGPYARSRLILTGTPAPNGSADLENLFGFVWPGQGRAQVSSAVGTNDLREASLKLKPLFVRTTKGELDLPPVSTTVRRLDLPPLHRELYDALLGQASNRIRGSQHEAYELGRILLYLLMAATTPALLSTGTTRYEPLAYRVPPLEASTGSDLATLMRDLPQYEMSPKYREVLAIVANNAEKNRKTLIWSTFVRNLTSLNALLDAFNPAVVHGGTVDRDGQLKKFREDDSSMVLLSNPATLGEGVSLHHTCHEAVYVDRDFAAGRYLQSLDRIHRLGLPQDTETRITILIANGTIDELVESRLEVKLDFMGRILDDPEVLALSDLAEEPNETIGMDDSDLQALVGHLRSGL